MNKSAPSLPTDWKICSLGSMLEEVDVRVRDLPPHHRDGIEVLSLTKRFGLIPQSDRFEMRVATDNVDAYKVVRRDWIVYNPYVIWEGAIHALRRNVPGIVSPVYVVWRRREDDWGFLDFMLRTPEVIAQYEKYSAGAVNRRRSIKKAGFRNITLAIPPLSEQRKIAKVLGIVRHQIQRQEQVLSVIAELRRTLLQQLFTRGLRNETQKQTELGLLPMSWQLMELSTLLSEPLRNGHSARATNDGTGIRTLTLTAVTRRTFSKENTKLTCADPERVRDLWLQTDDILVERANTPEYVGLAAIYEGQQGWAIFPDLMIRVRVNAEKVLPYFLAEYLSTSSCRAYFRRRARKTTGNFPKIDHGTVERLLVPIPALADQQTIADTLRTVQAKHDLHSRRLNALNALFRTLRHELMTARIRVDRLDPDLLTTIL